MRLLSSEDRVCSLRLAPCEALCRTLCAPASGGFADATWGDRNMYGLVIIYANAAIFHITKKLGLVVDSSMEAEGIATSKIAGSESLSQ